MVIRMVVKNVDDKIMSHIKSVAYSEMDRDTLIGSVAGYLDAMVDFGFINEMEYKNYMSLAWKG
jgi:hypothetical protein